jgi:hypothetical protein
MDMKSEQKISESKGQDRQPLWFSVDVDGSILVAQQVPGTSTEIQLCIACVEDVQDFVASCQRMLRTHENA